jgi:DNA adenine methylase
MKVRAIAPWFGGKRTMAPAIVVELGKHGQYFEPFCGSMAVLFAKPAVSQESVADLHGDVTNLAWILQDLELAEQLYDRAMRTLFAEAMIKQLWQDLAESVCPSRPDPERAYKFFVFSWAMRNGVAGTSRVRGNGFQIALRFTPRGGSPAIRFKSAVESIPAWHDRLRNVVVLCRDSFQLLPRFEDSKALAMYVDPPYFSESRSGFAAAGATSRYQHEFSHSSPMFGDDHERLRDELARFKHARVVVSYYDCPRIRQLYDGWTFIEHSRQKNLHSQNGRGARPKEAPEVLIINGPSYANQ